MGAANFQSRSQALGLAAGHLAGLPSSLKNPYLKKDLLTLFQSPLNGLEQAFLRHRRRGVVKGGKSARASGFPDCIQVSSAELSPLSTPLHCYIR